MNVFKTSFMAILFTAILFSFPTAAHAAKKRGGKGAFAGGSMSMGLGIALLTADQSGINGMIKDAKAATNATTGDLSSGYEISGQFTFRFSNNLVAIQLRPSYVTQSTSGSGSDGSHEYKLTGLTVFPLVRIIPLSNDIIDFYLQAGIGYGKLDGDITNGVRTAKFSGSSFGLQAGLGADFCLIPEHCFGVEGNYRYLPISRNIVSSASATAIYGASQSAPDRELENSNGSDVATTLTGISGALTYTMNF
jgi:opacity protein-like surface antigen